MLEGGGERGGRGGGGGGEGIITQIWWENSLTCDNLKNVKGNGRLIDLRKMGRDGKYWKF
jgi:hypothetical protein